MPRLSIPKGSKKDIEHVEHENRASRTNTRRLKGILKKLNNPSKQKNIDFKRQNTTPINCHVPKFNISEEQKYTISGVTVNFPVKAYPCQISMMDRIIKSLSSKTQQNAILESPTGSGKSLSILSAVLAWRQKRLDTFLELCGVKTTNTNSIESISDNADNNQLDPPSKVYFASRTHKQLSQLVRELGSTRYKPVMAVIGSRNHLCLNHTALNSQDINESCRLLLSENACRYYHKSEQLAKHMEHQVWDIEDIIEHGREIKACPYFAARELSKRSDVVFTPYNYLLDPNIRKAIDIDLKGSVIVIDEGHNIEDASREVAGIEISNEQLEIVTNEMDHLMILYRKSNQTSVFEDDPIPDLISYYQNQKIFLMIFLSFLISNYENHDSEHVQIIQEFEEKHYIWDGQAIITRLSNMGLSISVYSEYKSHYIRMDTLHKEIQQKGTIMNHSKKKESLTLLSTGSVNILNGMYYILDILLDPSKKHLFDFKMVMIEGVVHSSADKQSSIRRKLAFWCLNPGVIFKPISDQAKTIILTSGTLSPMDSFASELQTSFPIRLEASHVIEKDQLWVGVIPFSPSGMLLSGVYKSMDSFQYQDEIGKSILDCIQVIPHGVLCFVPSYAFLKKVVNRWKATGLYEQLASIKSILIEPQHSNGSEFKNMLDQFYEYIWRSKLEAKKSGNDSGGCLLFAVYRGKVSEGLDFADDQGRAVIAVGIPFPSLKDIQVNQKREYNNNNIGKGLLNGNQWYEIQAFRAMNQALGRCIRHKKDWGAIILLDHRHGDARNRNQLSKWVRQSATVYDSFGKSLQSLKEFMNHWRTKSNSDLNEGEPTEPVQELEYIPL